MSTSNDSTKLPHCPRCGCARQPLWGFCAACHFNAKYEAAGVGWVAAGPWEQSVRAELARQAMEMRAHAHHTRPSKYDASPVSAWPHARDVRSIVIADYEWLGGNPIRLLGEDA